MASTNADTAATTVAILGQLQSTLDSMQRDINTLASSVDTIIGRLNVLAGVQQVRAQIVPQATPPARQISGPLPPPQATAVPLDEGSDVEVQNGKSDERAMSQPGHTSQSAPGQRPSTQISRIVLTTYPGQSSVDPISMHWGHTDPAQRGPVVVSRAQSTIKRRNAIGAHGGSYSVYQALAVASNNLDVDHRPDFTNTEPAVNIGPFPQWSDPKKIVSMDPLGHLAPWLFKDLIVNDGVDIRPTIAITRAHMKISELEQSVKSGRLVPDGKICINESGELNVTKFAVEPVWFLPGVAKRFGIEEAVLRRILFEVTGGSFPELITRASDIKLFLPPIGGLTVYCFGDPAKMADPNVRLALRVHDECNGSDVFGSDICTCRPYLIFGIEEAVKEAQQGGSGVVIYFRKEGRALGEVTKYLVYNARKRGSDKASEYFQRTENIAGVKDMRFQALMPDVLHWLGIKKIDRMLSMSNMKYDAIVEQGIPIHERVPIPDDLIPEDSRVEIDAKIHAGYCEYPAIHLSC